jgi:hypothetical protein
MLVFVSLWNGLFCFASYSTSVTIEPLYHELGNSVIEWNWLRLKVYHELGNSVLYQVVNCVEWMVYEFKFDVSILIYNFD